MAQAANLISFPEQEPPVNSRPTYQFDIRSWADLAVSPTVEWLLAGWLQMNSVSVLYGDSNSGKSFHAIDWSLHIVAGLTDWRGLAIRQGPVLYIAAEGASGVGQRVGAWADYHGVTSDKLKDFHLLAGAVNFLDSKEVAALIEQLESMAVNPVLIVIDTLASCMGKGNGDEDKARDMGHFLSGADKLRQATGGAVVIVHHPGKDHTRGPRGSNAIKANTDALLKITVNNSTGVITLACDKQRDGTKPLPVQSKLTPVERVKSAVLTPFDSTPASQKQAGAGLSDKQQNVLRFLSESEYGERGATIAEMRPVCQLPQTTKHIIPPLYEQGLIQPLGSPKYPGCKYVLTDKGQALLAKYRAV